MATKVLGLELSWTWTSIFLAFWTRVLNLFFSMILVFSILPVFKWEWSKFTFSLCFYCIFFFILSYLRFSNFFFNCWFFMICSKFILIIINRSTVINELNKKSMPYSQSSSVLKSHRINLFSSVRFHYFSKSLLLAY